MPEPDATTTTVSIAWRTWDADQRSAGPKVDLTPLDALTDADRDALDAIAAGTSRKTSRLRDGTGSVAVELWIDPAADAARPDVGAAVRTAVAELHRIAARRCPAVAEALRRELDAWARRTATHRPDAPDDAPAFVGGETTAVLLPGSHAAVVAQQHPRRRDDDGVWHDLGGCVMVAVGPDRYGIRLRAPGSTFTRGELPYPNEPFPVRIASHLTALTGETDALASDLRTFETEVTKALAATGERDVRAALGRAQELLARRSELVGRARGIVDARDQLTRRRPDAFTIEAQDSEHTMEQVDLRLERLRGELVDIPQLLLAAGSWRQAQRTETLSLVAAGLIPPTLVVGALGANVLPWKDPAEWRALAGMLLLMLGSAAAGILAVRWSMARARPSRRTWLAIATAFALCAFGVFWLLEGTVTGDPEPAPPPSPPASSS